MELEEDGFVVVPTKGPAVRQRPRVEVDAVDTPERVRGVGITAESWPTFFDGDGRIVRESSLRKAIFQGGVAPEVRKEVWKYLFGFYPFHATNLEREIIRKEKRVEYNALKAHWKQVLEPNTASPFEMNFELDGEEDPQMIFMKMQADCNARRTKIGEEAARKYMRVIKKDVPRTDRHVDFYAGDDNVHLSWLHDILGTYAVYHPEMGYAQGMNDVLSMILFVLDDEAESYYCFCGYMAAVRDNFLESGMQTSLDQVKEILGRTDRELQQHLAAIDCADLVFCHRWMLLSFKREFSFPDALCLFEILSSHHLELSSVTALEARRQEKRAALEMSDGALASVARDDVWAHHEYKFECFICMAILRMYRSSFMRCTETPALYTLTNSLVESMHLDSVLGMAEALFFDYCRQSVHHSS
jgi:TBC1 domain family member 15